MIGASTRRKRGVTSSKRSCHRGDRRFAGTSCTRAGRREGGRECVSPTGSIPSRYRPPPGRRRVEVEESAEHSAAPRGMPWDDWRAENGIEFSSGKVEYMMNGSRRRGISRNRSRGANASVHTQCAANRKQLIEELTRTPKYRRSCLRRSTGLDPDTPSPGLPKSPGTWRRGSVLQSFRTCKGVRTQTPGNRWLGRVTGWKFSANASITLVKSVGRLQAIHT